MDDRQTPQELVNRIIDELRQIDRRIETRRAAEAVQRAIDALRAAHELRRNRPSPKENRKTITDAARYAEGLLSAIKRLPPDEREQLSFYLKPYTEMGETAENWIDNLAEVANALSLRSLFMDYRPAAQIDCVCAAIDLICTLSPAANPAELPQTIGSPFYLIAGYLWSAVSGKQEDNLKHYCDAVLKAWRNGTADYGTKLKIIAFDLTKT